MKCKTSECSGCEFPAGMDDFRAA